MPRLKARSSRPCAASSFSMEQKRVPEPKAMQEIISPVFPSRRLGNEVAAAPKALSAAPSITAAVVLFRKSRRDQRVFIIAPFRSLYISARELQSIRLSDLILVQFNPPDIDASGLRSKERLERLERFERLE